MYDDILLHFGLRAVLFTEFGLANVARMVTVELTVGIWN